jgi:hypothetical protein
MTPDEFGPPTKTIGKVFSLAFHTYQERPNLASYATWATVLVLTAPGLRGRLELNLVWASIFIRAPLLDLQSLLHVSPGPLLHS